MGQKGEKQRTKLQLEADRARSAEFILRGYSQKQIAEETGLSEATVSRDVAHIRKKWKESPLIDFSEAKQQELARLEAVERAAWAAWEASKGESVTASQRGGEGLG